MRKLNAPGVFNGVWRVSARPESQLQLQLERPDMLLIEDNGDCYEVDDSDCELSDDGTGFYVLAAEGEDFEDFYEFVDEDEYEDDNGAA